MFSSIGKVKSNFTNTSFIITSLILLLVMLIRVTRGLDLTDEMQYYGEIKGLIETDKLFSSDLFIQQSVYILLYPVFYIYHKLFDYQGFVFFGRLIMAVLTTVVFIYAYRKFIDFKFSPYVAGVTALSLTFSIPYHGIFAPSYNTISQALWIVFIIQFFEWKQRRAIAWAAIPIITAFAHPTSAVMMVALLLFRMFVEHDYKQASKVILALLGILSVVLPIFLYFSSPQEYFDSLKFSSGYGVGEVFFSTKAQPITLLIIYSMFGAGLLFFRRFQNIPFPLVGCIFSVISIVLFSTYLVGPGSPRIVYVLSSLSAFTYVWLLQISSYTNAKSQPTTIWLIIGLLAYATVLAVTSGNGIGQAAGAFFVGLPLLAGFAVSFDQNHNKSIGPLKTSFLVSILVLFILSWCRFPYRDAFWWQTNQTMKSVPEFNFIGLSMEKSRFIQSMQNVFWPIVRGKPTIIISDYPGLYLALGVKAETCMLYMHSLKANQSENILIKCLSEKKPEFVIDLFSNGSSAKEVLHIKSVMKNFYFQSGYKCEDKIMNFDLGGTPMPSSLKYRLCVI